MTVNDRIKKVRKELDMTQENFGKKLGVSRSVIMNIEYDAVDALTKPLLLTSICTTFGVSREWLETGSGDMFADTFESYINDVCERLKLNEFGKRALIAYLQLSETEQKALAKFAELIAAGKPTNNYTEILSAARAPNSKGAEKIELDSETLEKLENAPDKSHLY